MKTLIILISSTLIAACNIAFLVSKDNIVLKEKGYILIVSNNQFVEFIPTYIDTSLSIADNLSKYGVRKAYYIYGIFPKELNYLKIFADTISNGSMIIPVELEYMKKKEKNHQLRKDQSKNHSRFIKVKEVKYHYKTYTINTRYINATPFLSEEVKRRKSKNYEN